MTRRHRLAISLGDPAGLGPELLLSNLFAICEVADVVVVGPRAGIDLLAAQPGSPVLWTWRPSSGADSPPDASHLLCVQSADHSAEALWIDPTPELTPADLILGQGTAASGRATVEAIRRAADLVMSGQAEALVTLPMAKSAAHLAGYDIPGHTEFLQTLSGAERTRMAFVSPRLNVVLHTVHQSLRSVIEQLNAEAVTETLVFAADRFMDLTGLAQPRVALCALNPHAGESGAFGREEDVLRSALRAAESAFAQRPGPRFSGPHPSDSLFHRAAEGEFDLVVALYHDQGLIPVKVLEPTRAVNLTLGLPFIRTSPDHGTAFDKAGKWVGDGRNFLEAVRLAVNLIHRSGRL